MIIFYHVDTKITIFKKERHAKLNIYGNKDENGKYDSNSITLTFSDDQINSLLADYLNFKDDMIDNATTDMTFDYDTVINDLMINIVKMK